MPDGWVLQGLGGARARHHHHRNLSTTLTPAARGNVINTLSLILGQDSERSFFDAFQQAAASASFVVVNDGTNEQVIDLSQMPKQVPHQKVINRALGLLKPIKVKVLPAGAEVADMEPRWF
ncbi:MAG: hypothetical protein R2865_14010 [Deinococcales bacterium]